MEYYLLFFTLLPPFFIALLLMLKYRRLNKLVISVIFATLIHEIFLVTFPVLHSIINNFINEKELCINVTAVELTKVMIGESLYVFLFCLVLFIGLNFKSGEKSNRNDNKIFYSVPEVKLFRILIIIGTLSYGMQLFYLGTNISNGFLLGLNTYLGGVLFSFTPIIASAIILTKKD
ncbi:MAG: hypothetical protein HQ541_19925, partial [Mariniphaga sp.]|nr:hypothetical protein [Mariniphaga sp.]